MNKKKKITIAVVIFALIVIAAIYFTGAFVSAEEKLIRAGEEFKDLDSYTVEMDMNTEFVGGEINNMNLKFTNDIDAVNKSAKGNGEINFEMGGTAAKVGISYLYIDDSLYGSVDTFPYLALPLDANQVELITENDILLKENLLTDTNAYLADFLINNDREPKTVTEIIKEMEQYSTEIWEREAITVESVERDILDGKDVDKYTLKFDGEKLNDIYLEIIEDYKLLELIPDVDQEEAEDLKAQIKEQMKQSYEDMEVYTWMEDGRIVKTTTISKTTVEVNQDSLEEDVNLPREAVVTTDIFYRNFNNDFEIEAPEDYITLEELMNQLQIPLNIVKMIIGQPAE